MTAKETGFLSRWNERREAVEQEELALKQQAEAEQALEPVTEELNSLTAADDSNGETENELPEELPDPDQIEVGGSFASFMADNVDPLKKATALKALWKQPHYNEIDGLLEYALDYTNQPLLSEDVSAQLAKKVFRHVIKEEPEEELEDDLLLDEQSDLVEAELADMESVEAELLDDIKPEQLTNKADIPLINQQSDTLLASDNLAGVSSNKSQNEPERGKIPS